MKMVLQVEQSILPLHETHDYRPRYLAILRQYIDDRTSEKEFNENSSIKAAKVLQSLRDQIHIDDELFVFVFVDLGGMKTLIDLVGDTSTAYECSLC